MAWTTRVLTVLGEFKNKEGELKSRWEVTRPENDEGKHFAPGLQKTSFYKKDGEEKRGYPQALTQYDLAWIRDNWTTIRAALDPAPAAEPVKKAEPVQAVIEETPF